MITFVSGVPGSGKTYYAVTKMQKDRKEIHTNIDIKKDIDVKKFEYKKFYEKITSLYALKENATDTIQKSKDLGIFGISIYFDECHLDLGHQDKIVIWWLSWHRHLDQDIMLITQNKSTLAQKYRAYPEIFVDAHPATKRIFGSVMRYTEYASFRMSKDEVIRKFSIKIDPKIFEIYRTGSANKGTLSLRRKLYMIIAFSLVPMFMFYYVLTMYNKDLEPEVDQVDLNKTVVVPKKVVEISAPVENIVVGINEKWVNIEGWFFAKSHPLVKEMLLIPHKTHRVASTYTELTYAPKHRSFIDQMIENRFTN